MAFQQISDTLEVQYASVFAPLYPTIGQRMRLAAYQARASNPLINPPLQAVAAWASGTLYAVGNVVSNGGNDYVCYTGGTSAGSGGPTGTGAAGITDNTVVWFFYGLTSTTSNSAIAPTVTTTASLPGPLTNAYVIQTNDANFFYSGGVPSVVFSTQYRFPAANASPSSGNATANGNNYSFGVSFYTDAPKFTIRVGFSGRPYYFIVDGQYISLFGSNPAGSGTYYTVLDFTSVGGRKPRLITMESDSSSTFLQVNVDSASQVWAPDTNNSIRVIVEGDSYTSGGNAFPIAGNTSWPAQVGKLLGWNDVWNAAIGGTGYISTNGGLNLNLLGRITDITANSPNIVLVMAGADDARVFTMPQIQAAAITYYQQLRASLPGVPIIVTGIWASNSNSTIVAAENAIKTAVMQMKDPLMFFIPIATDTTGDWSTGTGNVNATTGTGNNDVYIGSDGAHPVQKGIDFLAYRLANAIRNVIAQIP